jgi:D-xylose 1-dehydrogenase (NADP+, D-xylono-1,5-lactone-forming)
MKRVKWGVLGCSGFAQRRSIPAMLQSPSTELLAVASRTAEKAEAFRSAFDLARGYASYDDLLSDPEIEAVHIPLPNSLHAEWTARALKSGKHVLCEKSFSDSVNATREIAQTVKETGLQFMEAFVWRMHPQHELAKALIDEGKIGRVRLMRAAFTFVLNNRPNIRLDRTLGGGAILDAGCYPISAARFYFADEPKQVCMSGSVDPGYDVDMGAAGILEFAEGKAMIDCSFDLPFRTDLEIVGDTGRIYFPRAWQPPEQATFQLNDESIVVKPANHYQRMFEHFSACILDNVPVKFGAEDAVKQVRTVSAVLSSIRSGSKVTV